MTENMPGSVWKETERLLVREFVPEDFEAVHEYSSDYENVRHMMFGPNTPQQTRDFLEKQCVTEMTEEPRAHYNFALALKESNRVIGGISLHLNWRHDDGILGAILNRRYTGKGYYSEGLSAVLDLAFDRLDLHRVHAVCDVDNARSIRSLERTGFRNEGRMVKRGKNRPEAAEMYFDQFGYAILAEEWNARKQSEQNGSVHDGKTV